MGSRVLTADAVEIEVRELGPRGGVGVVMAHATGFCAEVLRPLAARLGGGLWPVAFDERGHGSSGLPPEEAGGWKRWDWHGFGLDVLAVVDWIQGQPGGSGAGIAGGSGSAAGAGGAGGSGSAGGAGGRSGGSRPYGFGHSCGGAALILAELARPGTFQAIYAFEPVVFRPPPSDVLDLSSPLAELTRRRREVFGSAAEAYANFGHRGPFSGFAPAALAAYLECGFEELPDGAVRLACRREHEALIYEAGLAHDAWDHLGELGCPVTVAYGERSEFMDAADAEALASRIPSGQAEVVGEVGHFGPMERPDEMAASIRAAFDRATGSTQ